MRGTGIPKPLEREIQKTGLAMLRARGWSMHRRNVLAMKKGKHFIRGAEPGQSDTYGATVHGYHVELEFKRPGNRPTEAQVRWLRSMNGCGINRAVAFWIDDLDDLEQVARRVEQGWRIVYDDGPTVKPGDYHLERCDGD